MMVEALLLDFLLAIAILLLVPLGAWRGGLREVCSSAGLLLGILLGEQWAGRWGGWIADTFSTSTRGATFAVAAGCAILGLAIVGYGASAAFNYHPGPGGRMFGAAIAVLNGVVLAGYLINNVADIFNESEYPGIVSEGWLSRALSVGFDWILLAGAALMVLMTLLGLVVREREPADQTWSDVQPVPPLQHGRRQALRRPAVPESEKIEPDAAEPAGAAVQGEGYAPVKIREVRHWEEEPSPPAPRASDPITGWQTTWPRTATGERVRPPWESADEPRRSPETFRKVPPANVPLPTEPTDPTETLKQWIADSEEGQAPDNQRRDRG